MILQSLKYEALSLGAAEPVGIDDREGSELVTLAVPNPSLNLRVPCSLRNEARSEVNGSLDMRCLTVLCISIEL